ncbi:MAG: hypothetical protein VB013_03875 [Anaerolineaceae bacterium]|nr:hypothetical protein [Anaerolineaceae bacterium]
MRKFSLVFALLVFLISACTPQNASVSTQASTSTAALSTSVTPTTTMPPPTATFQPTPTATPEPLIFDRKSYHNFAIIKNHFSGLSDYKQGKSYSTLSTSLSPDGSKLAISACWGSLWSNLDCDTRKSGFLIVLDTFSGDVVNDIPLGSYWPGRAAFTSDNQTLMFSTDQQKIILWDLKTNQEKKTLLQQDRTGDNKYPDLAISPDDQFFIATVNGQLYVWNTEGKELTHLPVYQSVTSSGLTFNADGSLLAVPSEERDGIMIYNTADWTLKEKIPFNKTWNINFSADGRFVAAIDSQQDVVKIWQVANGEPVSELQPALYDIYIQFSPKSDLLLVTGSNHLTKEDDYSLIAEVYDTQNWTKIDNLYSFDDSGTVRFNSDGSQMAILSGYSIDLWGLPDATLTAGLEKVKQFQQALAKGDYTLAASLFTLNENQKETQAELGVDLSDLPGSFARLCDSKVLLCYPVKDLVMMGRDGDTLIYLVHLETPDGEIYTSAKGAQIIYLYANTDNNGLPELIYLPQDD